MLLWYISTHIVEEHVDEVLLYEYRYKYILSKDG